MEYPASYLLRSHPPTVFLDGTACCGKSTILRKLHAEGYAVVIGDYYEHCQENALWRQKTQSRHLDLMYNAYTFTRVRLGAAHDRSPLSNCAYAYIFALMDGSLTESSFADELIRIPPDFWSFYQDCLYVIVIDRNEEEVVARMIQRNNGLDVCSKQYVYCQAVVFEHLAMYLPNCVVFSRQKGEPLSTWLEQVSRALTDTLAPNRARAVRAGSTSNPAGFGGPSDHSQ